LWTHVLNLPGTRSLMSQSVCRESPASQYTGSKPLVTDCWWWSKCMAIYRTASPAGKECNVPTRTHTVATLLLPYPKVRSLRLHRCVLIGHPRAYEVGGLLSKRKEIDEGGHTHTHTQHARVCTHARAHTHTHTQTLRYTLVNHMVIRP
jgi:hypothetical protein